jgi:hypothetical protein
VTASAAKITGDITATRGSIGGFTIATNLTTGTKATYNDSNSGIFIGTTGIGLGANFNISATGQVTASAANISGSITATGGTIGGWSISPDRITGGTLVLNSNGNITGGTISGTTITGNSISGGSISGATITGGSISGVTLTVSGDSISGGTITGVAYNNGNGTFQVTSNGALTSTSATITGTVTATSGYIGTAESGFAINSAYIGKGKSSLTDSNSGVYIGADGISLGASSAFKVTNAGVLSATSGTIGGWTIGATTLTGGNVTLSSGGNVYAGMTGYDSGAGWYLANDGKFSVGNSGGNKLVWDGSKLKVTGGIYITDTIGIRNDGNSTLTITGGPSNASGGQIDLTPSGIVSLVATGGQYIQFYTGGAQRGYVQNDGKFDWLGTSEFDGAMTVNSSVTATSFNSTSSRKYKNNIRNLTNGLNIINNLRPVMFDWNDKDIKNDIGMIAEEVNEILPTIVYKNSNGEIDGLEYGKLVAVLTAAVKELSAEVQELKRQINELKK